MSISKFKTFTPASSQKNVVFARALRNLEAACIKARRHHQVAKKIMLFLRKQDFNTNGLEFTLFRASACPTEISKHLLQMFETLFQPGARYRATGVVLADLDDDTPLQFNLLEDPGKVLQHKNVFAAVDEVAARFGKHKVFLANGAQIPKQHEGPRGKVSFRRLEKLPGETERQHVNLPLLH